MPKIAVILSSTRPGRIGEAVAHWVMEHATQRDDAGFELIDLAEHTLPDIDEPLPPVTGQYSQPHTKAWAEVIAAFDGFVIVTPEYNHSFSGKLKNALDRVNAEWNNKSAGFVSYGVNGGVRAVEALRPVCGTLRLADVGPFVALGTREDWDGRGGPFTPREFQLGALTAVLDAVVSWATALKTLR